MSDVNAGAGASNAMVNTTDGDEEKEQSAPPQTLTDTGNGPSVSYEEALLEQYFGKADEKGVYGGRS